MEEEANAANVQVTVRCRPMNRTEIAAGNTSVFAQESDKVVLTHPTDGTKYEFVFDHMFGEDSAQEAVYTQSAAPILDKAFAGFNGTIFAYGQTGSGKTHCMMGSGTAPEMQGIIPRMKFALFERIQREVAENPTRQYLVECSYFEVYNEIIYDLLDASRKAPDGRGAAAAHAGQGLEIKEDKVRGIYVKGLKEVVVSDPESLDALMVQGNGMRTQAATNMNERSSRSHSIFTIQIRQRDLADAGHNLFAKINLVDLAGSERADKTGATGDRLKEGSNINKSLSELGNVINKLAEYGKAQGANKKKVFIPYRNSKLTRVLQESLGGNSLTVMIATFSPAASNFNESLTTLRYADRAKAIPVNATKNDESEAIEKLNKEIAALRKRLEAQAGGGGVSSAEARIMEERYRQQIQEIEGSMKQTWEEKTKLSAQYESERIRLLEEGKKETERLRSQFENERKRRWRLLEEKGDLEQVVKELYGWDEGALPMSNAGAGSSTTTAGARKGIILFSETPVLTGGESVSQPTTSTVPLPPGVDMHQWVLKYRSSIGLMQVAREHITMATVYRDSVVADISRAQASKIELSTESLTTAKSIMEQTDAKLTMMRSEFDCVVAKRDASMAELAVLKEMAKSSLTTVLAPRRLPPKSAEGVGDEAVGQGQGGMLTPVAPESPAPLNPRPGRPVRAKGIQLLSEPDEETGGTTVQESEAAGSSVDAPPPVVVEDMPVSEEAIQSQKLEVEALELLLRVIERQGSTLLLQGEEALRGYDLSAALPHLAALLQLELSRALPSSGVDIPSDATDASLSTILGQVTQLLPTPVPAGKKKPLPLKPPADPSSLTESVSSALVRLRARYSCQLASLAAAVQAQRASEASRLAGLEDTVSALKLRVAALEGSLATCEANLSKERSAGATLRQRLASINTELEVAKASHHSTAENASAATAQVTDLSRKLGEASEELVKTNLALTEALAELKDTSAKYTLLQTESAARIDTLNARVRKAEASAEEESNQNAALVAKLSTVENQVLELQTALVRVQAENDTAQERDKSSHSELLLLQSAVSEAKQDRDSQRDALAAALAEVQEMKERLIVAEEERDAARDKEEEYFRELEEREEQISRIQEGYVDISDRLNDKMDEVMEYQSEIEHWKSLSMSWQQKAMQAAAVTPRGSAMDAVPVRRAEMAARGTLCRMYTALQQLDADLRKAKAKPPKKRGDDEDEYDDDFDDDGAPDPQKPTLQTIPTPNFEDMDLAELSTALLACMTAVANVVRGSLACQSPADITPIVFLWIHVKPPRMDFDQLLGEILASIPVVDGEAGRLRKALEQRLRAEYEQPRVQDFEFTLQQRFTPERVRALLFHPSPEEFRFYSLLLQSAPSGAPDSHHQRVHQLTSLTLLHLHHIRRWSLVTQLILSNGLSALVSLFCSEDVFVRGGAIECFFQLTGHPSFDWFSPAVTSEDKELHGAMLALSHPSVALIGSLLANVPSSTPGADFTCLQILAFWLSWARKLYTGGKPLHVSRSLLSRLATIAKPTEGEDATEVKLSKEAVELAQQLFDDFSRFPCAEEAGEVLNEGEYVEAHAFVGPQAASEPRAHGGDSEESTPGGLESIPGGTNPVVDSVPEPVDEPAVVSSTLPPKPVSVLPASDNDRAVYALVLAAVQRRSRFGGTVVDVGKGSTQFDERMEEDLMRGKRSAPVLHDAVMVEDDAGVNLVDTVALTASASSMRKSDEDPDPWGKASVPDAAATMALLNKRRDAAKAKPSVLAAGPQARKKAAVVSLDVEWRKLGQAGLQAFSEKLKTVPPPRLPDAIGESLEESLLLGVVRALRLLSSTEPVIAAQLFCALPKVRRLATIFAFLSTPERAELEAVGYQLAQSVPDGEAVHATLSTLAALL